MVLVFCIFHHWYCQRRIFIEFHHMMNHETLTSETLVCQLEKMVIHLVSDGLI